MKQITKEELIDLIRAYDSYIQYANDRQLYLDGWRPVCIEEFYYNDFEEWK